MFVRTLVAKRTVTLQVIFAIREYTIDLNTMLLSEKIAKCEAVGRCF